MSILKSNWYKLQGQQSDNGTVKANKCHNAPFDQLFQMVHQQLEKLQGDAYRSYPTSTTDLSLEALEEIALILEELQTATEKLLCQNEELYAANQALRAECRYYQELFEFAPNSYLVTDLSCVIQEANREAATLLKVSQRLLVGKPLTSFLDQYECKSFRAKLDQLTERQSLQNLKIYLQPQGEAPLPVEISLSSITNAQDELTGWSWLIRRVSG